jgi:hypothetical protein
MMQIRTFDFAEIVRISKLTPASQKQVVATTCQNQS